MELLWILLGFVCGAYAHQQFTIWLFSKFLHRPTEVVGASLAENTVKCAVEQHQGQYFLYRLPDWFFLAQTQSMEDCRQICQDLYGKNFQLKFVKATDETSTGQ